MNYLVFAVLLWLAQPLPATAGGSIDTSAMAGADVIILGEVHDNPGHHAAQAEIVTRLKPAALVFEMLTADQAAKVSDINRRDEAMLATDLAWDQTGWPDFSFYFPIIAAGRATRIYGAGLTRGAAREAVKQGVAGYFGADASRYGLDRPLAEAEQNDREGFQRAAHCDALPDVMLPKMVALQRLRDAYLARAVVAALDETGGMVVVITGNGHARKDRGLARYLQQARPGLRVFALGQSEDGQIDGDFDQVVDYPATERADPCLGFEAKE